MIPINLLDGLRDFIQKQVSGYEYSYKRADGSVDMKTPKVYSGYLPVRTRHDLEFSPFIIVKLKKINDNDDISTADIRIIFTTHDDDDVDNWRSQFNLMEHVRQALLKHRTIANKFRLELPVVSEASEYSQSPYPEGYGTIETTYQIGQVQEEGLFNGYYGEE